MPGLPPDVLRASLRPAAKLLLPPGITWRQSRTRFDLATKLTPVPRGTAVSPASWGGVPGLEVVPAGAARDRVILYFHGGGFCTGSPRSHKAFAARIAGPAGARAVVPDYRMGDEDPFPAALDDALTVWRTVVAGGLDPASAAIAGDSAGGGLTLSVAMALRDAGEALPGALGLICPWVDLTPEANAARPDAPREPLLSRQTMDIFARDYLQGHDPADPRVSPILGDLAGLPPIVLHWAGDDYLAPDGRAIAEKARAAGLTVDERAFPGLWHDFHLFGPMLAGEGSEALGAMGTGLRRHLA